MVPLNALDPVRVGAEDEVGAGVDGAVGDLALVGVGVVGVLGAPVVVDHYEVGFLLGGFDVLLHAGGFGFAERVPGGHGEVGHAGCVLAGGGGADDGRVAEEGNFDAVGGDDGGAVGFGVVVAATKGGDI